MKSSQVADQSAQSENRTDRRAHTRHALDLVGGLSRNGEQFVPCHIRDFCLDGMLLAADGRSLAQLVGDGNPIGPGSHLILRFSTNLHDENREHLARVRVVRVSEEGFGCSFDGENSDAIWELRKLAGDLEAGLRENRAAQRRSRAPGSPMPLEQALNAGELLEAARSRAEKFLIDGMTALFKEAEQRLIAGANMAGTDSHQTDHMDALKEVQSLHDSIETAYLDTVLRSHDKMVDPDAVGEFEHSAVEQELALVDTGRFDDWVNTKNIISRAEKGLKKLQYQLEQKLTHLTNTPIDDENNPIGLTPLCLAFHDSLQGLGASGLARRIILEAFEQTIVKGLKVFYEDTNTLLSRSGFVPAEEKARTVIKSPDSKRSAEESQPEPAVEQADSESEDLPDEDVAAEPVTRAPAMLPPLKLGTAFQAAGNLISMQRASEVDASAPARAFMPGIDAWAPAQATMEQHEELLESLSILQRSPRFAGSSECGPLNLRQTLNAAWRSSGIEAASDHHMMLDVVSNLIDAIMDDPFVSDDVKVRIRRLAVPILKVAFQDSSFFENPRHPARQLLDSLGRLDPESTEKFTETVDPVVNAIIERYETDPAIFSRVLAPLKAAVSKQKRKFQENLERLVSERQAQQDFIRSRQESGASADGSKLRAEAPAAGGEGKHGDGEWDRWLTNARRCKPGDVLSIEGQKGKRRKLTLAWVSDDKSTYVLVDSLGNKAMSMTAQELAMYMKRGSAITEDIANMALTDRGTYRMLRSLHEQLARNASHDQLTDVLGRKEFEARLDELITDAVRNASRHVMYALEVEGLQSIVQKAGSKVGKELLVRLARLLEKNVANHGSVARLGPTRFGVLLNATDLDTGKQYLERQREIIAKARCMWRGETFSLTTSAAILEITDMSEGVDAMVKAVDSALGRAAEAGGNQVMLTGTVYDPLQSNGLKGAGRTTVLDMLNMDSLRLRCQRVVPLAEDGERRPHYEVLLGVQREEGNVALPTDFIRAAERNHEMQMVDRWVINSVFAWVNENQEKATDVDGFSINLSTNSLSDESVLEFVLKQFSESMVPPSKIIFEFPESAAAANVSLTADFVTTLKSYGCRFAIDDFGMADKSFSYLNSLPVDFVKIDGKLVVDILSSAKDLAVVRSINEIGHLLGKQTIAEFAENEEILDRLRDLGVDYAQGYGIEKPSLLESL